MPLPNGVIGLLIAVTVQTLVQLPLPVELKMYAVPDIRDWGGSEVVYRNFRTYVRMYRSPT